MSTSQVRKSRKMLSGMVTSCNRHLTTQGSQRRSTSGDRSAVNPSGYCMTGTLGEAAPMGWLALTFHRRACMMRRSRLGHCMNLLTQRLLGDACNQAAILKRLSLVWAPVHEFGSPHCPDWFAIAAQLPTTAPFLHRFAAQSPAIAGSAIPSTAPLSVLVAAIPRHPAVVDASSEETAQRKDTPTELDLSQRCNPAWIRRVGTVATQRVGTVSPRRVDTAPSRPVGWWSNQRAVACWQAATIRRVASYMVARRTSIAAAEECCPPARMGLPLG